MKNIAIVAFVLGLYLPASAQMTENKPADQQQPAAAAPATPAKAEKKAEKKAAKKKAMPAKKKAAKPEPAKAQ